jgi:hypothetical protein
MDSLCQIKIPPHIFEALIQNKGLESENILNSEKLGEEA